MKDNNNTFKYIAGASFALLAVLTVIDMIQYELYFWGLFSLIGSALIAVSMFVSVPALTAIGSALYGVIAIHLLITDFQDVWGYVEDSWFLIQFFIPGILFLVFWVLLFVAGLNPKSTKKLGIAAGIIAVVSFLCGLISNLIVNGSPGMPFTGFLYYLAGIVGALMIGLSAPDNAAKEIPANAASKATMVEKNYESQIDRLTKLKSLLDSGAITQEEFDQKKKQILG